MYQQRLNSLRDYILEKNAYLNSGYVNAILTEDGVLAPANGELISVFPADYLGNYFYIRDTQKASFVPDQAYINDCQRGFRRNGQYTILVAVVDADADLLSSNILTSLLDFSSEEISLNSIVADQTQVIMQELGKSQKADIEKALRNIDGQTLIAITFTMSVSFQPVKCITTPCKKC